MNNLPASLVKRVSEVEEVEAYRARVRRAQRRMVRDIYSRPLKVDNPWHPNYKNYHVDELRRIRAGYIPTGTLRPIDERIVVRPDKGHIVRESNLIIPDTATVYSRANMGLVLAVGPKQFDVCMGDTVLYHPWGGAEIEIGDTPQGPDEVIIIPGEDILAIVAIGEAA
jgi:co-chaperonin GroES (HSP10)